MKTAELTGALLDYWVAMAGGNTATIHCGYCFLDAKHHDEWMNDQGSYHPSTNWSQGGLIIERERIWLSDEDDKWIASLPPHVDVGNGRDLIQFGMTPLQAAMRAYVASKFGDQVDDVS